MDLCKVENCNRFVFAAGYCSKHYARQRTTGTVEDGPRAKSSLAVRLWRQVERRGPDECWPWIAKSLTAGYGYIGLGGRSAGKALAHRVAWELTHGPIPASTDYHGMVVMHKCDNRVCCNPAHLVLGRQKDNVRDMHDKGRNVSAPTLGEKHYNAKLTDEIVRAIRSGTKNNTEWARELGITRQAVRHARLFGWKHIK